MSKEQRIHFGKPLSIAAQVVAVAALAAAGAVGGRVVGSELDKPSKNSDMGREVSAYNPQDILADFPESRSKITPPKVGEAGLQTAQGSLN